MIGSLKDRAALRIIQDARASDKLQPNQPVIEMTSGNMGAGLAVVCNAMNHPFIATMSIGNSPERRKILEALGAQVILVPQVSGAPGKVTGADIDAAVDKAKEIAKECNGFYVDQFNNLSGVAAHHDTTGPEIYTVLEGKVNAFVAGVGTGGTLIGTASYLKEQNQNIQCIGVEPLYSSILKTGRIEDPKHIIQGIGYGRIPPQWKEEVVDDLYGIHDDDVLHMTKELAKKEGLFVGLSSGANLCASIKYLASCGSDDTNVVTMLCDSGYKYSY